MTSLLTARTSIAVACAFLAFSAKALEVIGYTPAANDRFVSGYPKRPVINNSRSFVGSGYDWSGVGWDPAEPTHSVTLISPRHFVYASHQGVGDVGKQIHFVNRDGLLKRYTIARLQTVPMPPDPLGKTKNSDLSIGTLAEAIPASDHVAHYRVLFLGGDFSGYLRKPILIYGHSARIGRNEIVDGFIAPGESADMKFLVNGLITGMAKVESGDSGSPSFLPRNSELTIVGTHSRVGMDTFLPALIGEISRVLMADGETLGVLDESRR